LKKKQDYKWFVNRWIVGIVELLGLLNYWDRFFFFSDRLNYQKFFSFLLSYKWFVVCNIYFSLLFLFLLFSFNYYYNYNYNVAVVASIILYIVSISYCFIIIILIIIVAITIINLLYYLYCPYCLHCLILGNWSYIFMNLLSYFYIFILYHTILIYHLFKSFFYHHKVYRRILILWLSGRTGRCYCYLLIVNNWPSFIIIYCNVGCLYYLGGIYSLYKGLLSKPRSTCTGHLISIPYSSKAEIRSFVTVYYVSNADDGLYKRIGKAVPRLYTVAQPFR